MTSVRLMLNKCRMLNDGSFPLVFQIIHCRQKRLINTGYRLKEQEFDCLLKTVDGCIGSSFTQKEVAAMNNKLAKLRKKIDDCIKKMSIQNELFTVVDLVECVLQKGGGSVSTSITLLQYIRMQIIQKKELGKDGTAAAYNSTLASLGKYVAAVFPKRTDVKLSEVTPFFVADYERFLYKKGMTANTVSYYLRNFRTLYNKAVREISGLKNLNAFKNVRTRPSRTVKRALTRQQLCDIAVCDFGSKKQMEFSRDLYLFSFYAQGMSFVDIVFLKKENLCGDMLIYKRHKSGQLIHVHVTPQMQTLMDKYLGKAGFIFPVINPSSSIAYYKQYRLALARINRHLARIAIRLSIDVPLTTYTARHTWATLAHYCGAPISVISVGLGHTSEEMTRVYLKEFDFSLLAEVNLNVTKLLQTK